MIVGFLKGQQEQNGIRTNSENSQAVLQNIGNCIESPKTFQFIGFQ